MLTVRHLVLTLAAIMALLLSTGCDSDNDDTAVDANIIFLTQIAPFLGNGGGSGNDNTTPPPPQAPTIISQPQDQTVVAGSDASFSVNATGTAPLAYQWQRSDDNGTTFTAIGGATAANYTKANADTGADNGAQFQVIVSNSEGSVTSNAATLTVSDPVAPTITQDPQDTTVTAGESATFTVQASGTDPLTYQWQRSNDDGSSWSNVGGNTDTYTFTTASGDDGAWFRVSISNSASTATSAHAVLTVEDPPPVEAPQIVSQPAAQTVDAGDAASFDVIATGTNPLSYQWQRSDDNGSSWADISGATNPTYNITTDIDDDGAWFRVIVSNSAGSVTSDPAALTVNSTSPPVQPPQITAQPQDQAATTGQSVTFSVTATGGSLNYQWQRRGLSGWNDVGTNAPEYTFIVQVGDNNAEYRVIVSNTAGTVTSRVAQLSVLAGGGSLSRPTSNG